MSGELGRETDEKWPEGESSPPIEDNGIPPPAEARDVPADNGISNQLTEANSTVADNGIRQEQQPLVEDNGIPPPVETQDISADNGIDQSGILNENAGASAASETDNVAEAPNWQERQANHAWEGHKTEFEKMGIQDEDGLRKHFDEIRENPDFDAKLPRGRHAFGKVDSGTEGTIIIDNPQAENGGTGFRAENVEERMDELRRRK